MISARIVLLSLLFGGVAGCAQVGTQPVDLATPTATAPSIPSPTEAVEATLPSVPSGWETHNSQQGCGYAISYPPDMENDTLGWRYSWILRYFDLVLPPSGVVPNFVYVSVIPDDFQSGEPGVIYNYDPAEAEILLNMQVGVSRSFRDDPNLAPWFTFTRLPDTTLSNQTAQTYENTQPWEFPAGTKEIRYYLQANGCTYLIGGYMATVDSGEPGAISEELFDEIIATFQVNQ